MTTCRECSEPASDQAAVCPHCGVERPGWRDPARYPASLTTRPAWEPGQPYPEGYVPLPVETTGAFGRPKRSGAFKVGERVSCHRLAPEGAGVILGVSSDWARGLGTKLYPRYLIQLDDGRRDWYNGADLTKISSR